jgi:NADPH-dependent 2,4-dienoyl-CoA reductase/sulfur reductase-like enzyme
MKAAEIAGRRGHEVTLFEKTGKMGGQFLLAALPPRKQVLNELVEYLTNQLKKLPVKIVTGKPFDPAQLNEGRPDVLVVATGGLPFFPPIPGIGEAKVFSVDDALLGSLPPGRKVLIIGGGGMGAEVADYLSETGKEVTLVEMREGIALDLIVHLQHFLNVRLKGKKVGLLTSTKATRFDGEGVWVEDPRGTRRLEGFDSIVIALGTTPNHDLADSLKGRVPEIYVVGDALKAGEVMEALSAAEEVTLKI